ncbi:MAG: hypothetical protein GY716_25140 [bacterium]|nr:hypothetical protein [bacterium]
MRDCEFPTHGWRERGLRHLCLALLALIAAGTAGAQTHLGTDFWFVNGFGAGSWFSIRVANPGTISADVTIVNAGTGTNVGTVLPGEVLDFVLLDQDIPTEGTLTSSAPVFHLTSTSDVAVFVFDGEDAGGSNDAMLVLPVPSLGQEYRIATYFNPGSGSGGPFVGVLAASSGTTNIQLFDETGTLENSATLVQGQYFQRLNELMITMSVPEDDMTGWRVVADQPVAVFSGVVSTYVGPGFTAADTLFQQLMHEGLASTGFAVAPTGTRPLGCTTPISCAPDLFRFVALEDATSIETEPPIMPSSVLDAGEYVELTSAVSFVITADKPFLGYRYLLSTGAVVGDNPAPGTGDPTLINITPPEYFRREYIFHSDATFFDNFINITAPVGTSLLLDGVPITTPCEAIGDVGGVSYCGIRQPVSAGVHTVTNGTTDNGFGLDVTGFVPFASYGYPAGLGLNCNTGIDGFMKDLPADNGAEPNPSVGPYWMSEDMWVRNAADPSLLFVGQHQDPIVGTTNYLYVRLRNRGCDDLTLGDVRTYFSKAAASFDWDGDWVGDFPDGDVIGSQPVGVVAYGDEVVLEFAWTPVATGHFCLLARLDSVQDPMTFAEGINTLTNTKNNNNIVWKNIFVVDQPVGVLETYVAIARNIHPVQRPIDLVFGNVQDPLQRSFLNNGAITVVLTQTMYDAWVAGGSRSQGMAAIPQTTTFRALAPYARLDNIAMAPGEEHLVRLTFQHFGSGPNDRLDPYVLTQWSVAGTVLDGGLTYVFPVPGEVSSTTGSTPLVFTDDVTLQWGAAAESSAEWFNLYRGVSGSLAAGDYGTCLQSDLPANTTMDADRPPVGVAWTYLVTGEGAGGEGTPGQQSSGSPRVLATPCP